MNSKRNVGGLDRVLRTGISFIMIYFGFFNHSVVSDPIAGTILGVFGVGSLVVATIGYCPFYSLIGFCTYPPRQDTPQA